MKCSYVGKRAFAVVMAVLMLFTLMPTANAYSFDDGQLATGQGYVSQQFFSDRSDLNALEDEVDVPALRTYLTEQLLNCAESIDVSTYNIPASSSQAVMNLISDEIPEAFHVRGMSYYKTSSGTITRILPRYIYEKAEYQSMMADCVRVANQMLSGIRGNNRLSDVEKLLLLHDRLATLCEYDYANLQSGTLPQESYSMYGALVRGTAVCQGYTEAYAYLLNQIGIQNYTCGSDSLNHIWNIVYVCGVPYHVDVTWDDPVWDITGRVLHTNFLRSSDGMVATNHTATDYDTTPTDTTYDNSFWQGSETGFQMIGDTIYYVDKESAELRRMSDHAKLLSLSARWRAGEYSYYPGCYSRLASDGTALYYSMPSAIYRYDVAAGTTEMIYEPDLSVGSYFNAYGFTYADGYLIIDRFSKPNFDATTKLNYQLRVAYRAPIGISGTITSTAADPITVELLQGGNVVATTTAVNGAYTFADVTDGDYTLRVSQTGMATAEVNVTVAGASVTKDVALYAENELVSKITHTLDLGGMISMSYHVTPGSGVSGVTAVGYLRDGVPCALESIPATDGRYHFTYPVAAKQMTDEIYFEVTAEKDGVRYTLTPDVFTVEQYCTAVISQANAPANLKEVARNMLTYGAYAQKYFGYNVDNLANKNNGVALDPTAVVEAVKKTGTDFHGTVKGQLTSNTLLLESEVGIRYFLTLNAGVNADNMYLAYYREGTAEVNYVKVTYENGRYHAVVPNIAAKNLSSYYVAYLCEKNGETYTQVSQTSAFSAACYAYAVYSNANAPAELKDCVAAMMMYGNAAKTLFGV